MGGRSLTAAIVGALVLAAAALAFRLLRAGGGSGAGGGATELLPILVAAAGLCTAGLLRHRAPAAAWLATVAVAGIAALEILAAVRARQAFIDQGDWPMLVLVAQAALLGEAAIAGGYAIRGSRAGTWRLIVLGGLAAVAIVGAWSTIEELGARGVAADPASADLPPFRISARLAAGYLAVMALAGIWRDLRGPLARARSRSSSAHELPRAIADELLPSAAAARRSGRDEERARLAADLHALVLPDLRRAALAAEAAEAAVAAEPGGAGGVAIRPGAAELREAVAGVERLMHARQSVVLEEYGLVAALEWLAERTQEHAGIEVDMELDGELVGEPNAVPAAVGRAAFRIALLAIDNVVRHAGGSRAVIRLTVEADAVRLAVIDDGAGTAEEPIRPGGRGLVDMRAAAAEIGAALEVARLDQGTAIALRWARPARYPLAP